jgi:DoxX-like family
MEHGSERGRISGYWVATIAVAGLFAVPGVALLLRVPHFVEDMTRLGYPSYFLTLLGFAKLVGVVAILVPGFGRLKEWAYAGLVFDALAASASRLAIGDGAFEVGFPLAIAALCLMSWSLRPRERVARLAA